jgi:hypothetical protein
MPTNNFPLLFALLPGSDVAGAIYDGMPCLICKKPVAPATGGQACPPFFPALHNACTRQTLHDMGHLDENCVICDNEGPHDPRARPHVPKGQE